MNEYSQLRDPEEARRHINQSHVNEVSRKSGRTLLYQAAFIKNVSASTIEHLLSLGFDANNLTLQGYTPIQCAVQADNLAALFPMLDHYLQTLPKEDTWTVVKMVYDTASERRLPSLMIALHEKYSTLMNYGVLLYHKNKVLPGLKNEELINFYIKTYLSAFNYNHFPVFREWVPK